MMEHKLELASQLFRPVSRRGWIIISTLDSLADITYTTRPRMPTAVAIRVSNSMNSADDFIVETKIHQ